MQQAKAGIGVARTRRVGQRQPSLRHAKISLGVVCRIGYEHQSGFPLKQGQQGMFGTDIAVEQQKWCCTQTFPQGNQGTTGLQALRTFILILQGHSPPLMAEKARQECSQMRQVDEDTLHPGRRQDIQMARYQWLTTDAQERLGEMIATWSQPLATASRENYRLAHGDQA